jgi:hypothetical protein
MIQSKKSGNNTIGQDYYMVEVLTLKLQNNYTSYRSTEITIFVNLGLFRHFETVTNIRTWIKSHRDWRML